MNSIPPVLFIIDVAATVGGMCIMQMTKLSRKITALSGGVMLGAALFWIWPDLTKAAGLENSFLAVAVATAALYTIDRFVYPVCPCCSRGHRLEQNGSALLPLIAAVCVHNLFDGWMAGMTMNVSHGSQHGLTIGLLAHKIPEAFVFGMMLRSISKNRGTLILTAVGSASCILAGGMMQYWTLNRAQQALSFSLAAGCATFLFIAFHTFEGQRRHGGLRSAFIALLLGLCGSWILEGGISFAAGS
jgi:zinc transporter ZupT